jgi:hypothetical protein
MAAAVANLTLLNVLGPMEAFVCAFAAVPAFFTFLLRLAGE